MRSAIARCPLKERDVASLWQLDAKGGVSTVAQIVLIELAAQPAAFDADNRVRLRVERLRSLENLDADGIGLQCRAPAGERFFDDEA